MNAQLEEDVMKNQICSILLAVLAVVAIVQLYGCSSSTGCWVESSPGSRYPGISRDRMKMDRMSESFRVVTAKGGER